MLSLTPRVGYPIFSEISYNLHICLYIHVNPFTDTVTPPDNSQAYKVQKQETCFSIFAVLSS